MHQGEERNTTPRQRAGVGEQMSPFLPPAWEEFGCNKAAILMVIVPGALRLEASAMSLETLGTSCF